MRIRLTRTDLLVLGGVVIWAAGFSIAKYGLREIEPLAFAAVRFLAAAVLIMVWVWIVEGKPAIRRDDWPWVVMVGLAQIGIYQLFFSVGLSQTTASNASLLDGTAPIWTAVFAAVFRKEDIARPQMMGILLSIAGLSIVVAGTGALMLGPESARGDIMILIAAILTGAAAVISKRLLQRYSPLRMMSISMVCGSLFLVPFAWQQTVTQEWGSVSLGAWLALLYSVVPAAVLAYVIYFKSIGEIGATRTAAYNSLMPPLAVVIAVVALGEYLTPAQILGAILVLCGVGLTRFSAVT